MWRKPNTPLDPKHLRRAVERGSVPIVIWGYIASVGVGNLFFIDSIISHFGYLDRHHRKSQKMWQYFGFTWKCHIPIR